MEINSFNLQYEKKCRYTKISSLGPCKAISNINVNKVKVR